MVGVLSPSSVCPRSHVACPQPLPLPDMEVQSPGKQLPKELTRESLLTRRWLPAQRVQERVLSALTITEARAACALTGSTNM